jgi:hypothetical protein
MSVCVVRFITSVNGEGNWNAELHHQLLSSLQPIPYLPFFVAVDGTPAHTPSQGVSTSYTEVSCVQNYQLSGGSS